ncbi:LexA/Signal peptidase, partial [Violaceomyces palustris]
MISPSRAFVRSLRPPPPSSSSSIFKAQTTCQLSTLRSSTIQNQQQTQDDDQPQLHSNRDQPRTSSHLLYALAWLPVAAFITSHIFSIGNVTGGSMSPTFNGPYQEASMANSRSDLVLLNRWAAGTHSYRVGDIVTLISPMDPNLLLTKRILALPGDVVRFWKQGSWTRIKIPPGHAWLEGDASVFVKSNNLDPRTAPIPLGKSRDSREFGPV